MADTNNIQKAKDIVNNFKAGGGTNIFVALKIALRLVELSTTINQYRSKQPIIIFLTDGAPTVDVTDLDRITQEVSRHLHY